MIIVSVVCPFLYFSFFLCAVLCNNPASKNVVPIVLGKFVCVSTFVDCCSHSLFLALFDLMIVKCIAAQFVFKS